MPFAYRNWHYYEVIRVICIVIGVINKINRQALKYDKCFLGFNNYYYSPHTSEVILKRLILAFYLCGLLSIFVFYYTSII